MLYLVYTLFLFILGIIFFQDFKQREISWWTLLLVLVSSLILDTRTLPILLQEALLNFSFVLVNLIVITIYFSIKKARLVNIVNREIGAGDILFFLVCCFIFSVPSFIIFFLISMFLSVLITPLLFRFAKQSTIPLAGIMAFLLVTISLLDQATSIEFVQSDEWINDLLL